MLLHRCRRWEEQQHRRRHRRPDRLHHRLRERHHRQSQLDLRHPDHHHHQSVAEQAQAAVWPMRWQPRS